MTHDNEDDWAFIPGKENITILRKYTVYNYTNAYEVLWYNETPELVEFGADGDPYIYQEKQDSLNITYLSEQNVTNDTV